MAKCWICGGKDDVIMAECSSCRRALADQKTDQEIEDIWECAGKQIETKAYQAVDFEDWS